MSERKELVTKERRARLTRFAKELADLCDKFKVDIEVSPDSEQVINLIEREFRYPAGYAFSATFQGVDKRGVWNNCNVKGEPKSGLMIDRWEAPE